MRTLSKVLVGTALIGCVLPGQQLSAQSVPEGAPAYRNQLQDLDDDKRCVSYGAQPGTESYADCRAQLHQAHEMVREAAENQANEHVEDQKAALVRQFLANQARQQQDSYDQQMMNIRAWGQRTLQPATPTANCITNYVGNYAYTNCQ